MLQFNVVWCIHSRREIVLTIQSGNGKQGYKVGGKKYRRPKVVLSQRPLRTVLQRLDSETRGILSSQRAIAYVTQLQEIFPSQNPCSNYARGVTFDRTRGWTGHTCSLHPVCLATGSVELVGYTRTWNCLPSLAPRTICLLLATTNDLFPV